MFFFYDIFRLIIIFIKNGLFYHLVILQIAIFFNKNTHSIIVKIGKSLQKVFTQSGPAFIKLGQFLSTRPDLLNKDLCSDLENLRDNVRPISFEKMMVVLRKSFDDEKISLLSIDNKAIASASISQVYKGKWQGEIIALKVLRPSVKKEFAANLRLMRYVAITISKTFAKSKRLKLLEIVNVIEKSSEVELDLLMEAAAMDRIKQNINDDTDKNSSDQYGSNHLYVPNVIWELCTSEVLAMEWLDGISITSLQENITVSNEIKKDVASKMAISFFHQAYNHGFFHADWHGGNLLYLVDGRVALLDYGIVCFLPEEDRLFIASILHAFLQKNYEKVALLHWEAGYIPKNASIDMFALACRSVAAPIIGKDSANISMSDLLKRLFMITSKFEMETQPQLILLQKNMIMLEGTIYSIYPNANLWEILEPWLEEWAKNNLCLMSHIVRKSKKLYKILDLLNIDIRTEKKK